MPVDERDILPASALALVIFEVWKIYEDNAPSLAICRAADSDAEKYDVKVQQNDTDLLIGGMILIVSGTFAYYTKKPAVLVMSGILLASLSLYRRVAIESHSTSSPR